MQINFFSSALIVKTLLLIFIVQLSACSDKADTATQAQQPVEVTPAAIPAAPVLQSATPGANTGIVKSAQVAGSYSYLETDINGSTFWIATTAAAIKPGEKISWNDYAMMKNFNSKALNRTFDQIMFVDRVRTASSQVASAHSGTVLETMNASGYSYIQVDENGRIVWIAAPEMVINVGQNISWSGGAAMQNFSSRSLDRVFDEIFFVGAVKINNG